MFTNLSKHLIYILFTLTVFVLLIIQLQQLIQQYILPFLRQQIAGLKKLWVDLQTKVELLSTTKKRLKKQLTEQDAVLSHLEKKVKSWHETISEKQKIKKIEQKKLFEEIREKKQQQTEYLQKRKIEKEVVPNAIKMAKNKLLEKYSDDSGKELLSKILSNLVDTK